MTQPHKPTRAELLAATARTIRDVIAPGLDVLFCGINPGLYSGATGHHFARPGNRFWAALHAGGFTDRTLYPWEEHELLDAGCGITNLVARTTATAAELDRTEYLSGRKRLERKVQRFAPQWVAFVGIGAYREAFERPRAVIGRQEERIGDARIWVLPNPSGLNANHQAADLARLFGELHRAVHRR
ncbi:MAG TPA: G/U mismatch-specific DNA glycosylase [Gemmatimonadales bacterium]|jgi:TDG/mug DNA glycosylase family protein